MISTKYAWTDERQRSPQAPSLSTSGAEPNDGPMVKMADVLNGYIPVHWQTQLGRTIPFNRQPVILALIDKYANYATALPTNDTLRLLPAKANTPRL